MIISEPQVLAALERRGLSLTELLGLPQKLGSNAELSQVPSFAPLVQLLELELKRAKSADPLAGVDVARFSHRLFDQRFLRSPSARFELAGVVSRPDRAAFAAESCGETRLIYRLAYRSGGERASKLPMTIGLELQVPRPAGGCRAAAARWLEPKSSDAEARAAWLRSEAGPLSSDRVMLGSATSRLVLNLQLVRWPATVRPDLGGHAEYLLRSFRPDSAGVLQPEALENTVDPDAGLKPERRRELLRWLEANQAAVDAGTAVLPDAFLAERSLSVTPRGLSRLANRPFSALLTPRDLQRRDFSQAKLAKTPVGLLRRLDQLSCQGCHQARSVAGFHFLGADSAQEPIENALALPVSPQVLEDLPRRLRVAEQMLAGQDPNLSAPFAERAAPGEGGYGSHCSLNRDATFADWKCEPGLVCSAIEAGADDPVGQCLPPEPQVGDACESGSVTAQRDHRRDRMKNVQVQTCSDMVCNRSGVGFPGGMCTAACGAPGAACGPIAVLDSFNACLARGETFLKCIRGNVNPAGLRGCDIEHPCRDDYVCARGERGGVCLPPYFVFQLRVDGHSSQAR